MTTELLKPETRFEFEAGDKLIVQLPASLPEIQLEANDLITKPWTPEMALRGAEVFGAIGDAERRIKELFEDAKALRHGAHQVVCQAEASWLKPFADLKKAMKQKSTAYLLEQERIRKAAEEEARKKAEDERLRLAAIEEAKAEEARKAEAAKREEAEKQERIAREAREEADRKEREARAAFEAGETAKAKALQDAAQLDRQEGAQAQAKAGEATEEAKEAGSTAAVQAAKAEKLVSTPVRIAPVSAPPVPRGMSLVKTWKGRVTDLAQLATAFATGIAPDGILEVNQSKLDKWARETEGKAAIPGIEAYQHSDTSNR